MNIDSWGSTLAFLGLGESERPCLKVQVRREFEAPLLLLKAWKFTNSSAAFRLMTVADDAQQHSLSWQQRNQICTIFILILS
jgi:hypothetical protein